MTPAVKTSATHPLEIPAVGVSGGGRIGMTLCPGKRQLKAVTGPWDRQLDADIAAIKAFGAEILVTLMGPEELMAANVSAEALAAACRGAGIDWIHLPIADFAAPGAAFEASWETAGARLRQVLRAGGTVVLHCRGGRGRSGMIAARLIAELGEAPEAAIARVRAAQPLAMETTAQEEHVRACEPRDPSR